MAAFHLIIYGRFCVITEGLTRYISSLLYGIKPLDFVAIAGAALILFMCVLSAGWLPARRAASIEPASSP